jgi:hypothetical protein
MQLCETFRTEKLPAVSAMFGRNILTTTIIVDMKGFAMSKWVAGHGQPLGAAGRPGRRMKGLP